MEKTKNRVLSILLCVLTALCLAVGVITGVLNNAYAEEHDHSFTGGLCSCGQHNGEHTGWTEIADAGDLNDFLISGGKGYLSNDIKIDHLNFACWNQPAIFANTTLCLNGKVLDLNGKNFKFNAGFELNLYDCGNTVHKFTDNEGLWVLDEQSGDKTVTGGVITGGKGVAMNSGEYFVGGCFYVSGSTFNMYGGNIVGNTAEQGAAVMTLGGSSAFNMSGGAIIGNKTSKNLSSTEDEEQKAGAVYAYGPVNLSGNAVISNNISLGHGGAIYVHPTYTLTVTDNVKITNNIAEGDGGAIYNDQGSVTLSGNFIISNNIAGENGGALASDFVSGGDFDINGGKIINNRAVGFGGAISQKSKVLNVIDCEITDNETETEEGGGGIYLNTDNFFVGGSTVIKDNYYTKDLAEYPCDVCLHDSSYTINIDGGILPTSDMRIGIYIKNVSSEPGEILGVVSCDEDTAKYFFTNNDKYQLNYFGVDEFLGMDVESLYFQAGGFRTCDDDYSNQFIDKDALSDYEPYGFKLWDWKKEEEVDTGYIFDGWYTERTGGKLVSKGGTHFVAPYTEFEDNKVYYAHWKISEENSKQVITETLYVYKDYVIIGGKKILNSKINSTLGAYGLSYDSSKKAVVSNGAIIISRLDNYDDFMICQEEYMGGVYVGKDAKFIMNSGEIIGNYDSYNLFGGAGVCVDGGTFVMNNGAISYNTKDRNGNTSTNISGGGVSVVNGGTFTMNGGEIEKNRSISNAGGVFIGDTAKFTLNDGKINYNTAQNGAGGGVCLEKGGTFIAVGGEIIGNEATATASGVYVSYSTFEEDDDPFIYYCLAEGTPITLGDGSRVNIENLKEGDTIRVFDHETGKLSTSTIYNLQKTSDITKDIFALHFTNDIEITIINSHSFFSREENKYVTLSTNNARDYIGKEFYNADSACWEKLEGVSYPIKKVNCYSIVTDKNLNAVANGMLSNGVALYNVLINIFQFGDDLKIDADKKQEDIAKYGLWNYEEANYATKETFDALNLQYLKVAIGKGMITKEQLAYAGEYQQEHDPSLVRGEENKENNNLFDAPIVLNSKPMALTSTSNESQTGIYFGGAVKIIDNMWYDWSVEDYVQNNVFIWSLEDASLINIGTGSNGVKKPTSEMQVGVSLYDYSASFMEGKFTNGGTDKDLKYFTSDNQNFACLFVEDALAMVKIVAKIDDTNYFSLKDAIDEVENNQTIVLFDDNEENIEINRTIAFKIDVTECEFTYNTITFGANCAHSGPLQAGSVYSYSVTVKVAKIGDNEYTSLQAAIENVEDNETIVLLENSNEKIEIDRAVTFNIDTDGYTYKALTFGKGYTVKTTNEGNVYTYGIVVKQQEGKCLSAGAIVAIVLGSVLLLLLILYVLGYFFLYRKGKLDDKKIRIIYKWLPRDKKVNQEN